MRFQIALASLVVAGSCLAAPHRFPVDVEQELNGLDIVASNTWLWLLAPRLARSCCSIAKLAEKEDKPDGPAS